MRERIWWGRHPACLIAVFLIAAGWKPASLVLAQESTDVPRIALSAPLTAAKNATTKLVLRGWKLDTATEVHATPGGVTAKIVNKGGATVPGGQEAKQVGDTQVEIELAVPKDISALEVALFVVTPQGETAAYSLLIDGESSAAPEKEPNDGFRAAQPIEVPCIVDGQVQGDRDVDVFSFSGEAGQEIVVETIARRRGSALDSLLTLYDERGNIVAVSDDLKDGETQVVADSRLELALPSTGRYFIALVDALDRGGPAHPYRLVVRSASE